MSSFQQKLKFFFLFDSAFKYGSVSISKQTGEKLLQLNNGYLYKDSGSFILKKDLTKILTLKVNDVNVTDICVSCKLLPL